MKKLLPLLMLLGCDPAVNDEVPVVDGKADGVSFLPAPGDTAPRLYFDAAQSANLDGPQYWLFTAKAHHSFTLSERALDSSGATNSKRKVGFKVYRLARSNHYYWKLVGQVDSRKGVASFSYKGDTSRYYLFEASAGTLPTEVSVSLTCAGGDHSVCALGGQPGDSCGSRGLGACDDGLFCQLGPDCGTYDRPGQCAVQPTSCPPMGIACFPVCGCDGNTYCMGCDINQHGVSIAHQGACGCDDPNQYEDSDAVTPSGHYGYIDSGNTHYSYDFAADGTFSSERDPGCLFATPYHCEIAVAPKHGTFTVNGDDTVTLSYDDGTTATFITQTNCLLNDQLVGSDYGATFTLTH